MVRQTRRSAAAAPSFGSLPDALVVAILRHLDQAERLKNASLVCKRFQQLCCGSELAAKVVAELDGGAQALPRARALLAWLARHGSAVSDLELLLTAGEGASAEERHECAALVAGCLTACSSGVSCRLEELRVREGTPVQTTAWLPAMTALKYIDMGSTDRPLRLPCCSLKCLKQLEGADLGGAPLQLPAALPPGMTYLGLYDKGSQALPPQVTQLSELRQLTLFSCSYSAASLEALSCLAPTLTSLRLEECAWSPSLGSLTGLQRLRLRSMPCAGGAAAEQLDAALRQLRQLTMLVLARSTGAALPPAAAGLPLQRLAFLPARAAGNVALPALPGGPWLQTCSHLLTHIAILATGPGVLAMASCLDKLCFSDLPDYSGSSPFGSNDWDDFWTDVSEVESLTQVSFELSTAAAARSAPLRFVDDLMWLRTERPDLKVFRYRSAEHPNSSFMEFFNP